MANSTIAADPAAPSTLAERLADFQPETYHDFNDPDVADQMRAALKQVESELGRTYPNRVGGDDVSTDETYASTNPGNPNQVIGIFPRGDEGLAESAVEAKQSAEQTLEEVREVLDARTSAHQRALEDSRHGLGLPDPYSK